MKRNFMCFFLIIILALSFNNSVKALTLGSNNSKAYDYKYIDVGHEKLHIENRKILDSDGNEFVMNGIAIAQVFGSTSFKPERYSLETFKYLKEAGFNSIRFQVTAELFYNYSTQEFKQSNLDTLKELMHNAEEAGIYIILDMHGVKDSNPNQFSNTAGSEYCFVNEAGSDLTEGFYRVWEKLAETVKDYKSLLAYELLNEPQVCYSTTQQAALDYYSNLLQTATNKIRAIDPDTIISFQPVHNYRKYSESSFYPYASPEITKFPNVTGGNFLVDSKHEYNNLIYNRDYRVINMVQAQDVEVEAGKYHGYNSPGISKYPDLTSNMTVSQTIACDTEYSCRVSWFALTAKDFNNGTITPKSIKIYQVDEDGTEHLAFEANSGDPQDKLDYFKISNIFTTKNIKNPDPANNIHGSRLFEDEISNLHVGMENGKKVRIEFNLDLTGFDSNSSLEFEYTLTGIKPNKRGYSLVQAKDKLDDFFANLDEISAQYGSPLYFGEFCLISYYINDYSHDREYVDDFYDYAKKYHLNWIWHRMSEYPADNGYGAYINGITPSVENRRPNQWAYGIPKLLSLTPEYGKEEIDEATSSNEKEIVANPKTGVQNCILIALIIILMSALAIHEIKNKDKFKTNI